MRNSFALAGLLLFAAGVHAQVYGGYRDDDRYDNRDYGRDGYYAGRQSYDQAPLDQVAADLDRAAADMGYLSRGELKRVNHTRDEIREFQDKWRRGRFDKGELDDVISGLQHVVDHNRLEYRDRDILLNDLARLRDFRYRSGNYRNGRDDRYGYGHR